jgi:hypothetical protein
MVKEEGSMRRRRIDPIAEERAIAWLAATVTLPDLSAITNERKSVRLPARCRVLDSVDHSLRHGASVGACAEFLGVDRDSLARWRRERLRFLESFALI